MGEQLICKLNPTSDLVKKQLSQLRDQWQTLKQMAANQMRALGGAKNLQEFNKKVDKLEAWIKEKVRNISVFLYFYTTYNKNFQFRRKEPTFVGYWVNSKYFVILVVFTMQVFPSICLIFLNSTPTG